MSDAAAFLATYSDWKVIKGRKVVQIVLEKSLESSDEAYKVLGGMPNPAAEVWVGVSAIDPKKIGRLSDGEAASDNLTIGKNHTSEHGAVRNSLSQRAALLCNDPQFRLFLERTYLPSNNHCNSEADAAEIVRHLCDVESRADIKLGTPAADKFDRLVANFTIWKHADKYVETPRIQQENQA